MHDEVSGKLIELANGKIGCLSLMTYDFIVFILFFSYQYDNTAGYKDCHNISLGDDTCLNSDECYPTYVLEEAFIKPVLVFLSLIISSLRFLFTLPYACGAECLKCLSDSFNALSFYINILAIASVCMVHSKLYGINTHLQRVL